MTKLKRSFLKAGEPGYQPLHVGNSWRRIERKKEKLLSKTNWYKGKKRPEELKGGKRPEGRKEKTRKAGVSDCSTVIFIPNTKSGTLVRKLREREAVMKKLTGFWIKFQESGGSQLRNSFSLELGKVKHCGRECTV